MIWRAHALLILLLLAGCASSAAPRAPLKAEESEQVEAKRERRDRDLVETPSDEPPRVVEPAKDPGIKAGPYDKRSGAKGKATRPPPEVRFVAPRPLPRPVSAARRPLLDGRHKLAVAFVRRGRLVRDARRLLRLESRLADDEAIASVTAVPQPKRTRVDLDALALLARRAGRRLLLVSVEARPEAAAKETLVRRGWLLDTQGGKGRAKVVVLARFDVHRGATIATASGGRGSTDLLARLERAHARLGAE